MRANGGCMVTKETSTAWLKYNYGGDPVRIVGLKSLQKLQAIGNCYLNRFYVATDFGLKLMYALTKFLETARTYPESLEFQAIQRATGVKNFSELLQDTAWKVFVSQAIDNPVLEGRCLDGALSSLKMSLPAIIKPKMPEGVIPLYLWTEDSLQRYCESFMAIFDSNLISGDSEERTYGLPWLAWKMNPILGLPMEPKSTYHEGDYDHGRHPVNHCLQPLKTGQFPDEAGSRGVTAFLHKGNKKNTTKYSTNEFEFTYITPFSPVTIFHHDGYMLFAKRIWPELADVMEDYGHKAFDMLMKLLFLDEDIRREYLTFIAPLDARPATDGQLKRWVSQDGKKIVPTSFGAMPILGECSGYDGSELLSSHLRWWKVRAQGGRYSFYPSFESWKRVAVSLGYARETGGINNTATDLSALTYVPPVPTFVLAEEDPKPPAKIFYKHFNIWRERIDIELKNSDAKNPRSRSHPSNGRDPVQWTPPAFDRLYSAKEICDHADPTQRLFYNALFPNGAKLIRLVEQERELAEIKKDLRRWREFVQRSESEDLSSAEMAELDAFWGKYPDTRINDLPSRIATLEIAWCDGKLALNPGRYDRTLYERLKEVNQDLMAWQRIVDPDRRVNLKHQEESHEQLRRKYGDYSSQLPNIQRAIVAAKLDIAKYDQNRWRALLERQRVGNLQPQEIDEFNELQSRYEDGMIRLIVIALTQKLNALRGGDADDDSDAFFEVDE
jgi:hypothetical protein